MTDDVPTVRTLWTRIEALHAVTYFAEESTAAARAAGLRGFWMGYFGFRAAPLGTASAEQVGDAFYNFAPAMVERAIPDAWGFASPPLLVDARVVAAASALRRLVEPVERLAPDLIDVMRLAVEHAPSFASMPLFNANRELPRRDDPVEELWQMCTTLREHRGDGHVAALRDHGISGCEAHILFAADSGIDRALLRDNRGWSEAAWDGCVAGLVDRDLLDSVGNLTPRGRAIRSAVETQTDRSAADPWKEIPEVEVVQVLRDLSILAREIVDHGPIPFPNPMGLPRPEF